MKKISLLILSLIFVSCSEEYNMQNEFNFVADHTESYDLGLDSESEFVTLKNGITLEKKGDRYIFEGDIILSEEQLDYLLNERIGTLGAIINQENNKWPNGRVPYVINSQVPSNIRTLITTAINHWGSVTSIRFVNKNANDVDYVEFIMSSGNSSYVGKRGGRQEITLSMNADKRNVIHEMGHAVGLIHEHSRRDRDDYINVEYSNINPEYHYAYNIKGTAHQIFYPFDFNSIMLYAPNAYAINSNQYTMTKKDGTAWVENREELSIYDISSVRGKYDDISYYKVGVCVWNVGDVIIIGPKTAKKNQKFVFVVEESYYSLPGYLAPIQINYDGSYTNMDVLDMGDPLRRVTQKEITLNTVGVHNIKFSGYYSPQYNVTVVN